MRRVGGIKSGQIVTQIANAKSDPIIRERKANAVFAGVGITLRGTIGSCIFGSGPKNEKTLALVHEPAGRRM